MNAFYAELCFKLFSEFFDTPTEMLCFSGIDFEPTATIITSYCTMISRLQY